MSAAARPLTPDDLDWLVAVLRRRRHRLVPHAPVFWRPAPDADARHRAWLAHVLGEAGGLGWRTAHAALVATPDGDGFVLDDVAAPDDDWSGDGDALWAALVAARPSAPVRFVCPAPEPRRTTFARRIGLVLQESWWLRELDGPGGGSAGVEVVLPGGVAARTVAAPPIYAPPGPVLYLPGPAVGLGTAAVAVEEARRRGCAAVVVNRRAGDDGAPEVLDAPGFRWHCDFLGGTTRG